MNRSYLNYLEGQIRLSKVHDECATPLQHAQGISSQTDARGAACLPLPLDLQRSSPLAGALDGASDSDVLENPLIGDMARLVLSPSGTHRKPSLSLWPCSDD
jgi:hypothetical protein